MCEITLFVGGMWAAKHNLSQSELPTYCLNQICLTWLLLLCSLVKSCCLEFSLSFSVYPENWLIINDAICTSILSKIMKPSVTAVFTYLWRQWRKSEPQLEGEKVIGATSPLSFPVAWLKVRSKGDTLGDRVSRIITYAYGKCERCCFWTLKIDFNPTMLRTQNKKTPSACLRSPELAGMCNLLFIP